MMGRSSLSTEYLPPTTMKGNKMTRDRRASLEEPRSLTPQLKGKSRARREGLTRLSRPSVSSRAARNDVLPSLALVHIDPDDLRPTPRHVRKVDEAHVRDVAASIRTLGFCAPVLIGKANEVLDGKIRVEAAKLLGFSAIPCVRIDHLTEVEQRMLRLAVNRLAEKGEWDLEPAEDRIRGVDSCRCADRDLGLFFGRDRSDHPRR